MTPKTLNACVLFSPTESGVASRLAAELTGSGIQVQLAPFVVEALGHSVANRLQVWGDRFPLVLCTVSETTPHHGWLAGALASLNAAAWTPTLYVPVVIGACALPTGSGSFSLVVGSEAGVKEAVKGFMRLLHHFKELDPGSD